MARTTLAASLLALGTFAAAHATSATTLSPMLGARDGGGIVQTVQWRGCRYWRHECARRWGWGGWRWRRCLARHVCL